MSRIKSQKRLYSKKNKRIGVLGGTFDPPHMAHIHMAESAKADLELDYVVFMPLGVAPHGKKGISSSSHRLNMLELILSKHKCFLIDDYEVNLDSPSYTVDSAMRINELLGKNSEVYFIIGADSLMYLEKWYSAKMLLSIANFAVIPRSGFDQDECMMHIKKLNKEYHANIEYLKAKKLDLSSTNIRENYTEISSDKTTKEVLEYIKENNLYKKIV